MTAPTTSRPARSASLSPLEEVADLLGGAAVGLLPLFLLAVPGAVLFVLLPLLLLAVPLAAAALVVAPPLLLLRLLRSAR